MADATTTYDVITRYLVDDKSTTPVMKITREVQTLERSAASAGSSMGILGKLGGVVAGYLGFQQANKSLIQFNSGMEQAKITMAGLMAQAGRGTYAANMEQANTLVKQMQLDARASIGTTEDFVQMASMLVQPLTMAGASMENLRDLTKQTVVASKSMGIEASVAARDIDQAIRGTYRSVDPFSGKVLTPMGYGGEEGRRKFNQLSMQQRLAEIRRGLGSQAIADMAKAQETSFAGASSTFVDNLQMTFGKVGIPLFKGLTAELNRWNTWLDKNQVLVDKIAQDLGGKLLTAAIAFKDAVAFAAEHWKQMLGAATAIKSIGILTSLSAMSQTAGGTAAAAAAGGFFPKTLGGAGGFAGQLAVTGIVASAIYIGATSLVDYLEKRQQFSINQTGTADSAVEMLTAGKINTLRQYMQAQGLSSETGFNREAFTTMMEQANLATRGKWADALGLHQKGNGVYHDWQTDPEALGEAMAKKFVSVIQEWNPDHSMLGTGSGLGWMDKYNVPYAKVEKPKINVTINRIEVATDDPDRFVMKMVGAFRDAAKNPSGVGSALHTLREG